jgi:hypothetical protein
MLRCVICRFETVPDDIVLRRREGCVCLGCYARATGSSRPMPKPLRQALTALLAGAEAPPIAR